VRIFYSLIFYTPDNNSWTVNKKKRYSTDFCGCQICRPAARYLGGLCTHCECVQREKERRDITSLPEIERFCFARLKKVIPTASTFFLWEHKSWRAKRLKDRRVFVHWRFSNDGGGGGGRVGRKKIKKFSNRVSSYVPLDILYITCLCVCVCVWVYTKYCNVVTIPWVNVCVITHSLFLCV
jgi:hypothetical protein